MRFPGFVRLSPLLVIVGALVSAGFLFALAPAARAAITPTASGVTPPPPTPTPVNAFITIDVTSGGPSTAINVTGGQFLPNQQTTLYWDQPNKVAGSATADANGSFSTKVKPFDGDAPGVHKLCASVPPNPCATFSLEPPASALPSPSPSPSPSPEASASAGATASPSASPVGTTLNGFDVISKPPFVFLPLIGIAALVVSLGYWVMSIVRRPRTVVFPSAAVVHRATRPDYTAPFGTPPPAPTASAAPSAWEDIVPKGAPPPDVPEAEPPMGAEPPPPPGVAAEPPPSSDWPELPAPTPEEMREEMRQFLSPSEEPTEPPEPGR